MIRRFSKGIIPGVQGVGPGPDDHEERETMQ